MVKIMAKKCCQCSADAEEGKALCLKHKKYNHINYLRFIKTKKGKECYERNKHSEGHLKHKLSTTMCFGSVVCEKCGKIGRKKHQKKADGRIDVVVEHYKNNTTRKGHYMYRCFFGKLVVKPIPPSDKSEGILGVIL